MQQMMEENYWPILNNYEDCWPVRSILKMALKYSAEKSRRKGTQETQRRIREVLGGPNDEHSGGSDHG